MLRISEMLYLAIGGLLCQKVGLEGKEPAILSKGERKTSPADTGAEAASGGLAISFVSVTTGRGSLFGGLCPLP